MTENEPDTPTALEAEKPAPSAPDPGKPAARGSRSVVVVAGLAFLIGLAGVGGAVYHMHKQKAAMAEVTRELAALKQATQGLTATSGTSQKSLTQQLRSIWSALRKLEKTAEAVETRVIKVEEQTGASPAMKTIAKQIKDMRATLVLLGARVQALETQGRAQGKTVVVDGDNKKPAAGGAGGAGSGEPKQTADRKASNRPDQPPFWNGCIDSLNKTPRLAAHAEEVCDCIIGQVKSSKDAPEKDLKKILSQPKFSTIVLGISGKAQKVLEGAVVKCSFKHLQKKKAG